MAPDVRYSNRRGDRGYFSREHARSGRDLFPGAFSSTIEHRDPRLPLSALVYGIEIEGRARAYAFGDLLRHRLVEDEFQSQGVVVFVDPRPPSAAAYRPLIEGRRLKFAALGEGRFRDTATGSIWGLDGEAREGPLRGRRLEPHHGLMAEWYGWSAHYPDTTVWTPPAGG